jgi:hypothetical protein
MGSSRRTRRTDDDVTSAAMLDAPGEMAFAATNEKSSIVTVPASMPVTASAGADTMGS